MKNYEKYEEEIKNYADKNFCRDFIRPIILKIEPDGYCNRDCVSCSMLRVIWLLEEYEELEVDWSKVKVDTPILVRHSEKAEWIRRYFAKYENGIVYAWGSGLTSWTTHGMTTAWQFAKLAEDEGDKE